MVESCIHPVAGVVALGARLREIGTDVVRIRRALEIFQVAADAIRAAEVVVAADMAIRALARRYRVHARQCESRDGVVECGLRPLHGVMAVLASRGEAVVRNRTGRAGEILLVARVACHAGQVVVVVDVTVGAFTRWHGVAAGQKESGRGVIELGVQPVVRCMTGLARRRELRVDVIRIRGSNEVLLVAGVALRRHRLESTVGAILVASIAVDGRVCTRQRESIVVLLDVFVCDLPSTDGVALFAISSQLAPVNVGVTILAALSDIGENHLHVTLRAGDRGVHSTQRISRLIVIKFGDCPNRLPSTCRVAVLTR